MKDSMNKIQSLAKELAENANVTGGGCAIILAVSPDDDTKPQSISFMKGRGLDLLSLLTISFKKSKELKQLALEALFASSLMPEGLLDKNNE